MNREEHIQKIIENSGRLKHLALVDRSKLGALQLSRAQLELVHLIFFHERISVNQAAKHLSVSLSAVSQLADSLQSDGYISRQNDEKDRRIIYMSVTPKGKKVIKSLKKNLTSGFRAIMETLDDSELASLNKIYNKMVANAAKKE